MDLQSEAHELQLTRAIPDAERSRDGALLLAELSAEAAALVGNPTLLVDARLDSPRRGGRSPVTEEELMDLQSEAHELQLTRAIPDVEQSSYQHFGTIQDVENSEQPSYWPSPIVPRKHEHRRRYWDGGWSSRAALLDQQAATAGLLFRSNSTAPSSTVSSKRTATRSTGSSAHSYPLTSPRAVRTASSSSGLSLSFAGSDDDPLLSVLRKQADVSAKIAMLKGSAMR